MDPKAQFLFLLLAFIALMFCALGAPHFRSRDTSTRLIWWIDLLPLGLALWEFVYLYTAWKAV